ncbi:hypothetical protein QUA40_27700 [Microcoleus sp. Pol11C3]
MKLQESRRKNASPDRTLNILSATADAPKEPQNPGSRGGVRLMCLCA